MASDGIFVVGQTSSVKIHAAMANELIIGGLNSMNPPIGASSSTVTIEEFGVPIDKIIPTSITYDIVTCSGNFMLKSKSMEYLRQSQINSAKLTDLRWYFDLCSFVALELIHDPEGHIRVSSVPAPSGSKSSVYTGGVDFAPVGLCTLYDRHRSGSDLSFTAQAGGAIVTDASSLFVVNDFEVGQVAYIDYLDGSDPLMVEISAVAPGQLTFAEDVGDEASITTALGVDGAKPTMISAGAPIVFDTSSANCA